MITRVENGGVPKISARNAGPPYRKDTLVTQKVNSRGPKVNAAYIS